MTDAERARRMDVVEFRKWMGFYLLEPFGDEWRQTGKLCASVSNSFGGKEGGGKFKESDFMPTEMAREQSSEEMEAILMANMPR